MATSETIWSQNGGLCSHLLLCVTCMYPPLAGARVPLQVKTRFTLPDTVAMVRDLRPVLLGSQVRRGCAPRNWWLAVASPGEPRQGSVVWLGCLHTDPVSMTAVKIPQDCRAVVWVNRARCTSRPLASLVA